MVIRNKQRKTHTEQSRRKTNTQPENQQNNEQRDSDDGLKWPEDDFMKMFSYFLVTRLEVATLSTKIISIKISLLKNENKSQQIQMKPLISSLKSSNCCKIKYKGRYFICLDQLLKWHFPPKASESPLITTKAQPTAWRSQEALTSSNHKQAESWNFLCTCSVEVWQQRFQHRADITGMKVEDILFFFSSFLDQFNLQVLVEMIFLWFLVFIFVIFWFLFCWIFGFLF